MSGRPPERPLVGVGLAGFGVAGEVFHAPLISATPGLRLQAVATADPRRIAAVADRYPLARIYSTVEALLGDKDVSAVVVATPNDTHVELARAAIRANRDVVVDKPLATSSTEAASLAAEAVARGRLLTVFHNRRWDSDTLTLQDVLRSGELGWVHRFESRFERWRPEPRPGWRENVPTSAGGGILFDLGPHLVHQARLLFGPVQEVYAELARRRPGAGPDDDAFLALRHVCGTTSHLWMSALSGHLGPRLRVLGAAGALIVPALDPQEDALRAHTGPGPPGWGVAAGEWWPELWRGDRMRTLRPVPGDYLEFYRRLHLALTAGGPSPVPVADGISGLVVIEAALRSATEGRVIRPVGG